MKVRLQFSYIDLDHQTDEGKRIVLGFISTPHNERIARKLFGEQLEIEVLSPPQTQTQEKEQ